MNEMTVESIRRVSENAGYLDEDSDLQAVYLLDNLAPLVASLRTRVSSMSAADKRWCRTWLESF